MTRLLCAVLVVALPAAAAEPAPFDLAVDLPARSFATWQTLDATATLSARRGAAPAVVLPRSLRLVVVGASARFEPQPPVPGPPVNPAAGAQRLEGGGQLRVAFPDLGDWRGRWKLAPGRYQVAVEYALDEAAAQQAAAMLPAGVAGKPWTGKATSPQVTIDIVEPSAAWQALKPVLAQLQSKPASATLGAELAKLGEAGELECLAQLADRAIRGQRMPMIALSRALGAMRSTRAVPALLELVGADDAFVGDAAVTALGDIGDRRATPALVGRLEKVGRYERSWRVTLDAIQRLGDPAAVPHLRPFASDREAQVSAPAQATIRALLGVDAGR